MIACSFCGSGGAILRRCYSGLPSCRDCFIESFENDIYDYIKRDKLIVEGDRVCIGVSGGKDSSVLAHVLSKIRDTHRLDWKLYLLAIDEGIKGYRDDSLRVVENLYKKYKIELKILNFKDRYGFTMDQVVDLIGKKNNCTVCGSFRRQILEVGSRLLGANVLCTGHNADDTAETVLMNLVRGDLYKLAKSTQNLNRSPSSCQDFKSDSRKGYQNSFEAHSTSSPKLGDEDKQTNSERDKPPNASSHSPKAFRRIKPLMYCYEKEIVLYARFCSLEYFSTECLYSPEAYRRQMRNFVKNLEVINPRIIHNIIHSGGQFYSNYPPIESNLGKCRKCGVSNVRDVCKPCVIIDRLNILKSAKEEGRSSRNGFGEAYSQPVGPGVSCKFPDSKVDFENGLDSRVTHYHRYKKSVSKVLLSGKALELEYENGS